jgi:transcriptional regulator GlxA family with amidase domain
MLNAADAHQRIHRPAGVPLRIDIASIDGEPIRITGGIEIHPNKKLSDIDETDLIIIPGMWGNPKPILRRYPVISHWLTEQHQRNTFICATGTGVCFLADAGLLDNKAATTHWYYFDQFRKDYPKVKLQTKRFITNSGNIYCAGRMNSITNLIIHFIERFYSHEIARQIEQHFAHEIKQTYESIFYSFDEQRSHHDEEIIQAQQWMLRNYANEVSMQALSKQFDMSLRTFNRRFKKATDKTPLEYLQHIRLGTAKDLLKDSNLSIAEISYRVGLSDPSYFSALFKRHISLNPREYRRLVRAKLFSLEE